MTFHCKNYDISADRCKKLSGECVPARKGCVLEGRMVVSEELAERIRRINEETARRSLKQDVEQQSGGDR
ncbi:hypothetical protein VU08_01420 [Desulfobulbus sp. F5]|nr:hypothetical protein [Desulfobulbus sp. F5]